MIPKRWLAWKPTIFRVRKLISRARAVVLLVASGCTPAWLPDLNYASPEIAPTVHLRQIARLTHDTLASTQGLVYRNGFLFESTGGYGTSSLQKTRLESMRQLIHIRLPDRYYAEGVTELGGRLFLLTWQSRIGFVHDVDSLEEIATFTYFGEGWGITTDGESLIMSDGTNRLRFLDPETFSVTAELLVHDGPHPVRNLNELEWVEGELWANVWFKDKIAVINPTTGQVRVWVDLAQFVPEDRPANSSAVANGIAYDGENRTLFLTGKRWPYLVVTHVPEEGTSRDNEER